MSDPSSSREEMDKLPLVLKSGEAPDAIIRCGESVFNVHIAHMAFASPYFKAALTGAFEEAQTKILDLHDDDEEAVLSMLRFVYGYSYVDCYYDGKWSRNEALFDVWMYILGDKYDLPVLKTIGGTNFRYSSNESRHTRSDAKEIFDLIKYRLPSTDETLRKSLVASKLARLLLSCDGRENERVNGEEYIAQYPQFAYDMVCRLSRRENALQRRKARAYECPELNCTGRFRMKWTDHYVSDDHPLHCLHCGVKRTQPEWNEAHCKDTGLSEDEFSDTEDEDDDDEEEDDNNGDDEDNNPVE